MAIFPMPASARVAKRPLLPEDSMETTQAVELSSFYMKCQFHHRRTNRTDGWLQWESYEEAEAPPAPTPPAPARPGIRWEGQLPGETFEEAEKRMDKEADKSLVFFKSLMIGLGATVISVLVFQLLSALQ